MSDDEQQANSLMEAARNKFWWWSHSFLGSMLFNGRAKIEAAAELYVQAAHLFRNEQNWSGAGKAFTEAAKVQDHLENGCEAATHYIEASICFRNQAIDCLGKAQSLYYISMDNLDIADGQDFFIAELRGSRRLPKQVFMDINICGESVGRIVIKLFVDEAPLTCAKFVRLCTNELGVGYHGSVFDNVREYVGVCSADIRREINRCPPKLPPQLITPKEGKVASLRGGVNMVWDTDPDDVTLVMSRFEIILDPERWTSNIAFGQVMEKSLGVVQTICEVPVEKYGNKPTQEIKIRDCGVLPDPDRPRNKMNG